MDESGPEIDLDNFLSLLSPWSRHPQSPWVLISMANILAVLRSNLSNPNQIKKIEWARFPPWPHWIKLEIGFWPPNQNLFAFSDRFSPGQGYLDHQRRGLIWLGADLFLIPNKTKFSIFPSPSFVVLGLVNTYKETLGYAWIFASLQEYKQQKVSSYVSHDLCIPSWKYCGIKFINSTEHSLNLSVSNRHEDNHKEGGLSSPVSEVRGCTGGSLVEPILKDQRSWRVYLRGLWSTYQYYLTWFSSQDWIWFKTEFLQTIPKLDQFFIFFMTLLS